MTSPFKMSILVDHLESRLGHIQRGWTHDPHGVELPFQIAEFRGGGQLEGSTSFSTLGLAGHELRSTPTGSVTRMELIMTVHSAQAPGRIPQALQLLAQRAIEGHSPILRGQTHSIPSGLMAESGLSALYSAVPDYFDDQFDVVRIEDGNEVVIAWMVPITGVERQYIHNQGWPAFEQILVS